MPTYADEVMKLWGQCITTVHSKSVTRYEVMQFLIHVRHMEEQRRSQEPALLTNRG